MKTLTFKPKKDGYCYGTGSLLDMFAYAHDLPTSQNGFQDGWLWDAQSEAVAYRWRENASRYVRDSLNVLSPEEAAYIVEAATDRVCDLKNPDMLAGDVLDLDYPAEMLTVVYSLDPHDIVSRAAPAWLTPDAEKKLQEAEDVISDYYHKEWLHGDHRDWVGILRELSKKMFGGYSTAEMDYNEKTDTLTITAELEDWREYLGDEDAMPTTKDVMATVEYRAECQAEKDKAERENRAAERARLTEYKKKQAEEVRVRLVEEAKARKTKARKTKV